MLPMVEFFGAALGAMVGAALTTLVKNYINLPFTRAENIESQRDSDLIRIEGEIDELKKLSIEVWTSDARENGNKERHLIAQILGSWESIYQQQSVLFESCSKSQTNAAEDLGNLHTSITGGEFGSEYRERDDQRLDDILKRYYTLKNNAKSTSASSKPVVFAEPSASMTPVRARARPPAS